MRRSEVEGVEEWQVVHLASSSVCKWICVSCTAARALPALPLCLCATIQQARIRSPLCTHASWCAGVPSCALLECPLKLKLWPDLSCVQRVVQMQLPKRAVPCTALRVCPLLVCSHFLAWCLLLLLSLRPSLSHALACIQSVAPPATRLSLCTRSGLSSN